MGRSSPARRRSAGAHLPPWVPLVLALAGLAWAASRLARHADANGVATVDLRRYRLHAADSWFAPAWQERLERVLAGGVELDLRDRDALRALTAELEALSFVAEVGAPEVLWPDGLSIPLRLHRPIACLAVGSGFLPVAEDGTVLAGFVRAPPDVADAWLPVLAGAARDAAVGARLQEPAWIDGLAVARSMVDHLRVEDRRALGRVLIDARHDFAPDGLPGGVTIDLEDRRRILFGRSPAADAPGELPVALKWSAVAWAIEELREGRDWSLLDARWDEPVLFARGSSQDRLAGETRLAER